MKKEKREFEIVDYIDKILCSSPPMNEEIYVHFVDEIKRISKKLGLKVVKNKEGLLSIISNKKKD
jgi:hypothetical protein